MTGPRADDYCPNCKNTGIIEATLGHGYRFEHVNKNTSPIYCVCKHAEQAKKEQKLLEVVKQKDSEVIDFYNLPDEAWE